MWCINEDITSNNTHDDLERKMSLASMAYYSTMDSDLYTKLTIFN